MNTITIPKKEYRELKQRSAAYVRIAQEIIEAEKKYPYDHKYIDRLVKETNAGKWVEGNSVDNALRKLRGK